MREYRIAAKMKHRYQPPAHREFMDLMGSMACPSPRVSLAFPLCRARARPPDVHAFPFPPPRADRDFDVDHPDVVAARTAMEEASDEAESARKGQKASTNYHLSRHLRR